MNKNLIKKWNAIWDAKIHLTEHAIKRIKSAKSAQLTPIKIEKEEMYGYFRGSNGRYETWLDECNCNDFKRYRLPCKHIYRLAIELGLLKEKADTDINLIPDVRIKKVSLSETVDIIEALSEDAQRALCNIARNTNSAHPSVSVNLNNEIEELLLSGLVIRDGYSVKERIKFGVKIEIAQLLSSHNIEFSKGAKKSELENICISKIPEETKKHFGIIRSFNVRIPECFSRQNIHYYLHRKYDFADGVDEDVNLRPLIKTLLPDDVITDELIKRGYYRPENIDDSDLGSGRISIKLF